MTNKTQPIQSNRALEILVVEDKEEHILSAKKLLAMHNTYIAKTYSEAIKKLRKHDVHFDAVLSDLFFPYGEDCACYDDRNKPEALGYALSLYAARRDVPIIALITDGNHHASPICATFDSFDEDTAGSSESIARPYLSRPIIKINNSLFAMFDIRDCKPIRFNENAEIVGENYGYENGVKNWVDVLDSMLNPEKQIKPRPM
ncbi:MAG: hypothetical protein AABX07_04290 [Nanoarchaeota archaeon]